MYQTRCTLIDPNDEDSAVSLDIATPGLPTRSRLENLLTKKYLVDEKYFLVEWRGTNHPYSSCGQNYLDEDEF